MGTRCTVDVLNRDKEKILRLYGMYDGGYEGVGKDLCEFVDSIKIAPLTIGDNEGIANGIECLALQLVCHLKTRPGGWYAEHCKPESYHYIVTVEDSDKTKAVVYVLVDGEMVPMADLLNNES